MKDGVLQVGRAVATVLCGWVNSRMSLAVLAAV